MEAATDSRARAEAEVIRKIREDTPWFAREFLYIVNKQEQLVEFEPNAAQLAFEEKLQEQRAQGRPIRAIVLKARQVGMSTWIQAKMFQRTITRPNHRARVIAHDVETGTNFHQMAETMYGELPEDFEYPDTDAKGEAALRPLKPEIRKQRGGRSFHFAAAERDAWMHGGLWPNSRYFVDTAKEFYAGRGTTIHSAHCSELAFWDDPGTKMMGLKNAVPKANLDSLLVIESTAQGHNFFKDQWDNAVSGETDKYGSKYVPFFWPWFKQEEYRLPFLDQADRDEFRVGDIEQSRYAADEPMLMDRYGLDLEQLHWRRSAIVDECSGQLDKFREDYPSNPEEAFLGSGRHVFDSQRVQEVIHLIENDVKPPVSGQLFAGSHRMDEGRNDAPVQVPESPRFRPLQDLAVGEASPWKFWEPVKVTADGLVIPKRPYLVSVDVSGGEVEGGGSEPAFHAIEVLDHLTGEQVAEYSSRVDPAELTPQVFLAALLFNEAWIVVERTGYFGMPILRTLWLDYHYPYTYREKRHGATTEKTEHRLGWNTSPKTKPTLLSLGQELLAKDAHGIRSRLLAGEMLTYVRNDAGKTDPEPGKFADRLMAWLIGQQVRTETAPMQIEDSDEPGSGTEASGVINTHRVRDERTGY